MEKRHRMQPWVIPSLAVQMRLCVSDSEKLEELRRLLDAICSDDGRTIEDHGISEGEYQCLMQQAIINEAKSLLWSGMHECRSKGGLDLKIDQATRLLARVGLEISDVVVDKAGYFAAAEALTKIRLRLSPPDDSSRS